MSFLEFVARFRRMLQAAADRLRTFDERRASTPRAPGKWTPKQILGHLIDSAANNHARFVLAQSSDDLRFAGYEQDAWVAAQRYDARPWRELVDFWLAYNLHLAHVMEVTPAATRERAHREHTLDAIAFRTVPATASASLDALMRDYVVHLEHHLEQVFAR